MAEIKERRGTSLRNVFAAHALQGLIAKYGIDMHKYPIIQHCNDAFIIADEMMTHTHKQPINREQQK